MCIRDRYYGPSGVGKTELAKKISSFYDGKLTRIQFSMMQTDEAFKYIFGDTHGKPSLARDLLSRETNVVLIDEFDKVSPSLYNVFYQMFDEGEFEDINSVSYTHLERLSYGRAHIYRGRSSSYFR